MSNHFKASEQPQVPGKTRYGDEQHNVKEPVNKMIRVEINSRAQEKK